MENMSYVAVFRAFGKDREINGHCQINKLPTYDALSELEDYIKAELNLGDWRKDIRKVMITNIFPIADEQEVNED